jgi:UDP-N-acetylmuramoylalanine--D-glutamate ligase
MEVAGKNVLVVGMARSGLAAAEFLVSQGAAVHAADSKPLSELGDAAQKLGDLGITFEQQGPGLIDGRDLIVISPGVPADLELLEAARARGVSVIGELEMASDFLLGETIGITGANGKTTTTSLVGHILAECGIPAQVGGNIGTPPTSMIATSRPDQWNVLELSSFQLETIINFRATIGVALNVTPDHLDRHHTFEAYKDAKARLFETQEEGDFAVLNADDPVCVEYGARTSGHAMWFSSTRAVTPGAWLEHGRIVWDGAPVLTTGDVPLPGRHNLENVMAALAAARLAGAPLDGIAAAVRTFPGVEHRLEFVRNLAGVDYYNDSKATNVDATLKAIDAFDRPLWVILGGKDKGSDYRPLAEPLRKKARAGLLIGAAAPIIKDHLGNAARLVDCGTLDQAVEAARAEASAGDVVLLAPACASFDQFENFEHRGKVFKKLVQGLN